MNFISQHYLYELKVIFNNIPHLNVNLIHSDCSQTDNSVLEGQNLQIGVVIYSEST